MSTSVKEAFKEKILTINPKTLLGCFVNTLDGLLLPAKEKNNGPVKAKTCFAGPYHAYLYIFKHRMSQFMLDEFSGHNDILLSQLEQDLTAGGLYFAIANWLDWDNTYNLHEKYNVDVNLRHHTGAVLKYPLPIISAAAAATNTYLPEVISFIPMTYRKESCQLAADHCRTKYNAQVMPLADMEEEMFAAHRYLNDVCGQKINGYPLD